MDKYDKAIAILTAQPDVLLIQLVWGNPQDYPEAGCLFEFLKPPMGLHRPYLCFYGCLTQIRKDRYKDAGSSSRYEAFDLELGNRIRHDERIPDEGRDIRVEHLPIFAEYQREADRLREALLRQAKEGGENEESPESL